MTHKELLKKIYSMELRYANEKPRREALRAVVELHKPTMGNTMTLCSACMDSRPMDAPVILYPCPTIQAIEKELS